MKIRKFLFVLMFAVGIMGISSHVFAQGIRLPGVEVTAPVTSGGSGSTIQNPLGGVNDIPTFISSALSFVAKIGAVFAIFALIYAGFLYVKARGNSKEISTAHTVLKNTIIGIILLLGAQLIASIITGTIDALTK